MDVGVARLLADGFGFPEAPRWFGGQLWVSDLMTKLVSTIDAGGTVTTFAELEHGPMGIGFLGDGSALIVSMEDHRLLRYAGGAPTTYADLADIVRGRPNDLVVDGRGRVFVSDTGGDRQPDGTIFANPVRRSTIAVVMPGEAPRVVATELDLSNGMVVTPDGRTLIVSETLGERVTAFTITDDGSLVDQRVFASLPGEVPNGLCLDAEGAVWVASHNAKYLRVADGGEILATVPVPGGEGRRAVACMLGGEGGRDLFLVSSDHIATYEELMANQRRTGRVDVVTVEVPAAGWP